MTVKELIEQLSALPSDAPVLVKGYEWGWEDLKRVDTGMLQLNVHTNDYGGPHEAVDSYDRTYAEKYAKEWGEDEPAFIDFAVFLPRW